MDMPATCDTFGAEKQDVLCLNAGRRPTRLRQEPLVCFAARPAFSGTAHSKPPENVQMQLHFVRDDNPHGRCAKHLAFPHLGFTVTTNLS